LRHLNILLPLNRQLNHILRLQILLHYFFRSGDLILFIDHFFILFGPMNSNTFSQWGRLFIIALFWNLLYCGGIRVSVLLGFTLSLGCTGCCFNLFLNWLLRFLFHGYFKLGALRRSFYSILDWRLYLVRRSRFLFSNKL
jgi:hypothetical protein